jgi:tetratricopeptide (TPR) repeat protein
MTKRFVLFAVAALFVGLCVPVTHAQTTIVKGIVKDTQGKPIQGAAIEMVKKETGRKYTLKSDKKGEFFSLGIDFGQYDVTLNAPGLPPITDKGLQMKMGEENFIDFDLSKRAAAGAAQMSEAEKKQREEMEKENTKIKGLNEMLRQAADLQAAGNFEQSIGVLQQAVQADPNRDLLWFKLGDAQRLAAAKAPDQATKTKDYQDAIESYKKAIALKQASPAGSGTNIGGYWNNLGDAYGKAGMTPDAISAYQQAAQADPAGAGQYYFNLGAVLTNTNKPKEAVSAFDKAIQADPNKADAYYWKGVNLLAEAKVDASGKMVAPEGTAEALNKYLELEPTGQYADGAKGLLASIGATVETGFGKTRKKK